MNIREEPVPYNLSIQNRCLRLELRSGRTPPGRQLVSDVATPISGPVIEHEPPGTWQLENRVPGRDWYGPTGSGIWVQLRPFARLRGRSRHYLLKARSAHSAHSSPRWKWCYENTHIGVCSTSSKIHSAIVLGGGHTEEALFPQRRNHKDIYIQPLGFRL
jgi:hypothetical protein